MRRYLLAIPLVLFVLNVLNAESDQPPYAVNDVETHENFVDIYKQVSEHQHTGTDGSSGLENLSVSTLTAGNISASTINASLITASTISYVLAYTGNGFGATNTMIRRYTSSTVVGTAISYADSVANGASFTINNNGWYSATIVDMRAGGGSTCGISVNSDQLTTTLPDITVANRLAGGTGGNGLICGASIVHYFVVGDVIRPHLSASENADVRAFMRVTKIGP